MSKSPDFVKINPLWNFRTVTDLLLIFSKKTLKKPKNAPRRPGSGGPNLIFSPEFLLLLVRSPCKPYDNPFLGFE
jgi:hypothetical protein